MKFNRLQIESLESRALLSILAPPIIARMASPVLTPDVIRHAYSLDAGLAARWNGVGETIAIVDAFDEPNIVADLHAFDVRYGLPDPPHFTKIGSAPADDSWGVEIALDVEWAHAMAPKANIVLVETNSADLFSLMTAAQQAAAMPGVVAVSMSFGGAELAIENLYDSFLAQPANHPPVVFLASSGDTGGVAPYPSASPNVLSVGGTTLNLNGRSYVNESAWTMGGGGPAVNEPGRRTPDIALDADPATGVPVIDTAYTPRPGLLKVGGTSFSAPSWAGIIALADQARGKLGPLATADVFAYVSHNPNSLHDITMGSNTIYAASPGYDQATGYGTPLGFRLIPGLQKQPHLRAPRVVPGPPPTETEPVTPFWVLEE